MFPEDYKVHPICGKISNYDPKKSTCYKDKTTGENILYTVCPNGSGEISDDGCINKKYKICGNELYDISTNFCYNDVAVVEKCNGGQYNPDTEFCHENTKYKKCQVKVGVNDFGTPIYEYKSYNPEIQRCNNGALEDIIKSPVCNGLLSTEFCCFGQKYNKSGNSFCYKGELYPICINNTTLPSNDSKYRPRPTYINGDTTQYDPVYEGCFENTIYPKCINDGVTGPCVDNTLKRCKQLGSGMDHIVDPLPGVDWGCADGGKIKGQLKNVTKPDGSLYDIVQIGNQVWLAEDLAIGLDDWATSMDLPSNFNTEYNSFPSNVPWKGHCPNGFYVPSDEDWKKLVDYAGGTTEAGNRLKSTTTGWNGADSYGFNAKPKGYENNIVGPTDVGSRAMWWSLTQPLSNNVRNASYWTIISADSEARNHNQDKALFKAYVRCLYY